MLDLNTAVYNMDALDFLDQLEPYTVDAFITDLPYGVTQARWDKVIPFEPMWNKVIRALKPNGVFITTAVFPFAAKLCASNYAMFRYDLVWHKTSPSGHLNAAHMPLRTHESILVFYEGQPTYHPQFSQGEAYNRRRSGDSELYGSHSATVTHNTGYRQPTSVIQFKNPNGQGKIHSTQKPISLFSWLIKTYTNPVDLVVDFCCGSGTTGVAALRLGRRYLLNDIDPDMCLVAKLRTAN